MRIFFDSSLVGSPSSFTWDDGAISIDDHDPVDWHFTSDGPRKGCIRAASEAAGCSLIHEPNIPQAKFWKKHTDHPAWSRIIPRGQFGKHLASQVEAVVNFLKDPQQGYFTGPFQVQQALLDKLTPGRVKNDTLAEHGFIPDKHGFVRVPTYDNAHSSTGRMSITNGPKILTLQKDLRKNLTSRWSDGHLIEVDYNALEARVLSWISKNDTPLDDVYDWIGKTMGAERVPRNVIKEATLAAIYGMTKKNFALRYQDMPDAVDVYETVRSLMKVQELEGRLRSQQRFQNAFGRPLPATTAWVSYYVQSSAVDVACHGFNWLVDQLNPEVAAPVYLIHDALVLDVRESALDDLKQSCKDGLEVSIINQRFPVKMRHFNE